MRDFGQDTKVLLSQLGIWDREETRFDGIFGGRVTEAEDVCDRG